MTDPAWKQENIAWLAGLLEGEGSFVVRPKNTPYISLKMVDKDVVERAGNMLGAPTLRQIMEQSLMYYIQVYDRDIMLSIIPLLMPYLGKRRTEQATKLLHVLRRRKEIEADYLQRIILLRELHKRGTSQRELARMIGRAQSTIHKWICKSIPTVVQIKNYDWAKEGMLP